MKNTVIPILLLFLISLCVLVFFTFTLSDEDYWADEAGTLEVISRSGASAIWKDLANDLHAPLYFITLHYFSAPAEKFGLHLRWYSALWGLAGIFAVYFLSRAFFSGKISLATALLLAVNPFWLAYCRELRMYSMFPALLCFGLGFMARALKNERKTDWTATAIFFAAALWTHYLSIFFIIATTAGGIWILRKEAKQDRFRGMKMYIAIFAILSAPLSGLLVRQLMNNLYRNAWLPPPKLYGLFETYLAAYPVFSAPQYLDSAFWRVALHIAAGALLLIIFGWGFRKFGESSLRAAVLLMSAAFGSVIIMYAASFSRVRLFLPYRYAIVGLPPFLILTAWGLARIKGKAARFALLFLFAFMECAATFIIVDNREKPDWKSIASVIDRHVSRNDVIITTTPLFGNAYQFYSRKKASLVPFEDFMIRTKQKPETFYHLAYNSSPPETPNPYLPWLFLEYMKLKGNAERVYKGRWYDLFRYSDVDIDELRSWYLNRRCYKRTDIFERNPQVFIGAEDLRMRKFNEHSYPLGVTCGGEVNCWLHSPPVLIEAKEKLPPGRYNVWMKLEGRNDIPTSFTTISLKSPGGVMKRWHLAPGEKRIVGYGFRLTEPATPHFIIDGPGFPEPEDSPGERLVAHYYWIAVTRPGGGIADNRHLGRENRSLEILSGDPQNRVCFGPGWGKVEDWGTVRVLPLIEASGDVYLPVKEKQSVKISIRAYPFNPETRPRLSIMCEINGKRVSEKRIHRGWNDLEWVISSANIKKGINIIRLIPNRTQRPCDQDPANSDQRKLSIRVEKMRWEIEED